SISGKLLAERRTAWNRVVDRIRLIAEVEVGLFLHRRNGASVGIFVVLLVPFLAVVSEGAVVPVVNLGYRNGPADTEPVVVLVIGGWNSPRICGIPGRPVEESDGVEKAVAVDLE